MPLGLELIASVVVLIASVLGFWLALPQDGKVRPYLQNDHVQAYYAVALLGAFASGLLFTVLGLISLFSQT
jgi:hypothetical protein